MAKFKITLENGQEVEIDTEDGAATNASPATAAAASHKPGALAPIPMGLYDKTNAALGGTLMDFNDELGGGIAAATEKLRGSKKSWGDEYQINRNAIRDRQNYMQKQYPGESFGLSALGSLATMAVPGLNAAKAGSLGMKAWNAARAGVKSGLITGFGAGEGDAESQLKSTIHGGGTGMIPGLFPLVGKPVQWGVQKAVDMFPDSLLAIGAAKLTPGVRIPGSQVANAKIAEKFAQDNVTWDQAEAAIKKMQLQGKRPSLADVGKDNVLDFADATTFPSSSTRSQAMTDLVENAESSGERIRRDLTKAARQSGRKIDPKSTVNYDQGFDEVHEALINQRKAAATPLYDAAYKASSANFISDPTLMQYLNTSRFKAAFKTAFDDAETALDPIPWIYGKDGKVNVKSLDLKTLDHIKRAVDGMVWRKAKTNKLSPTSVQTLKSALHDFTEHLKAVAPPEYEQALAAFAGPTKLLEAAKAGAQFSLLTPNQLITKLNKMTKGEQEHFLLGAVDDIRLGIKDKRFGDDVYKGVFGDQTKRELLEALFQNKAVYKNFAEKMTSEKRMRMTNDWIRGNSKTTRRGQQLAELGQSTPGAESMAGVIPQIAATGKVAAPFLQRMASRAQGNVGRNAEKAVPKLFDRNDPLARLAELRAAEQALARQASRAPHYPAPVASTMANWITQQSQNNKQGR